MAGAWAGGHGQAGRRPQWPAGSDEQVRRWSTGRGGLDTEQAADHGEV